VKTAGFGLLAFAFAASACIVVGIAIFKAGAQPAPPHPLAVVWQEVTPPRPGLRCWMNSPGTRAAVLFCEPDLTATGWAKGGKP
jgi:hypothetical protein